MSLWAIVPVKPLRRGKSRLAQVLTDEQRVELNRALLVHTVDTLNQIEEIEHVLVVSRDPETLTVAREAGARTLREDGTPRLNVALTRAALFAKGYAIHGVLIFPADLPLLDPQDVREMIVRGRNRSPVVVIAPDRRHEGTNALLLSPPDVISFSYGDDSFEQHCESARQMGIQLEICERLSLSLDLDLPEDLELLAGVLPFDFVRELVVPVSMNGDKG